VYTKKLIKFFILLISVSFVFFELCSSGNQSFYNYENGNIITNVNAMVVDQNTNSTNFNNPGLEQRSGAINYDPTIPFTPTAPKFEENINSSSNMSIIGNNSMMQNNGFKVQTINGAIYINDNLIANSNEDVDTTIDGYKIVRKENGEVHISSGNNKKNVFKNIGNNSCNIINSNDSSSNNWFS